VSDIRIGLVTSGTSQNGQLRTVKVTSGNDCSSAKGAGQRGL